jgi:hypothetical protein
MIRLPTEPTAPPPQAGARPVLRAARRSTQSGENTGRNVVAKWMTAATPQPSSGQ